MIRRTLVLALTFALTPFAARAADLLETYDLARQGDPQLSAAESNRLVQKEGAVQARANLLPQVNGSASFSQRRSKSEGDWTDTSSSRDYSIGVQQSLWDWSRHSNLKSQRALSKAADFDLDAANNNLMTRISAAYFNVLVGVETLAAAEAAEAALKRQFDYAEKRLEVGLAPITDVHEARAQYDSARANTILTRSSLQDAYQALSEITGTPVVNLKALPDDFRPQLPSSQDADAWVETALAQNPSLKSTEYQVQSAKEGINAARSGHYPTLSLTGSYGRGATWGGGVQGSMNSGGSTDTQSIGITLNVPIYAGGAVQSKIRAAIAQHDSAQDGYEQQRRAIVRNTRNAYQTLVAGISEIEARRLALVSAQSAYDASMVGLEVGTRTVLDVLTNQQNLFNAKQNYATSKYNFLQNRLLLAQAAGTLNVEDLQNINRLLTVDAESRLNNN